MKERTVPLVLFDVSYRRQNPSHVEPDARAVSAERYGYVDDDAGNPGGITRAEIGEGDIRQLSEFGDATEVFVESEDPDDVLDDEDPNGSRIWWRGTTLTGNLADGGSA